MSLKSWLESSRVSRGRSVLIAALTLLALVILCACTVTTTNSAASGSILVNWTIASDVPSAECSERGAQNISLQALNGSGAQLGATTVSCTASSATIGSLPAGNYTIVGQLLDASGNALASLPAPVAVSVLADTASPVSVDFPASSFTTPVAGAGALQVNWTIASTADASLCATHSAQTLSIQVFNAASVQYGATTAAPCTSLTATIGALPVGTYTITVQMLDASGNPVTSLVGPLPEVITSGATTTQAIDFPETSFGTPVTNTNTGSLTVTWTVAGTATQAACTSANAANIVLQLLDASNAPIGSTETAACSNFTTTLTNLGLGTFTLTAKLVTASGADATTTATIPGIAIAAGVTTTQPIDFPTASFETSTAGTGSINVSWTIASGTDPASCTNHNATSISLQLYAAGGVTAMGSAVLDPCNAFAATITNLAPGTYALSAQLVNATSTVSTLVPPQPITVTANASATQAFDFPTTAF